MFRHPLLALAAAVALVATGCSSEEREIVRRGGEDENLSPVRLVAVPDHDLMAEVAVDTDVPVIPTVDVSGPDDRSFRLIEPAAAETHRLAVIGMHPDTAYRITVTLRGVDGEVFGTPKTFRFTAGSRPDDLPAMETVVSDSAAMEPGVTLFNLVDRRVAADSDPPADPARGRLVMVDATGEVVWYHEGPLPYTGARRLANGNLLVEVDHAVGQEINLFGEVVAEWASRSATEVQPTAPSGEPRVTEEAVAVPVDSMHDEHAVLPNGNHLTIGTELRTVAGFGSPLCGEDTGAFDGSYDLIGDVVVEFQPADGTVVQTWNLFDYYDAVARPAAADMCATDPASFPATAYPGTPDAKDWTHASGVTLDESRNALLVSIAHLDEVIALRWQDDDAGAAGDVLWRMGPEGDLKLTSGEWLYDPHAPEIQKSGAILLYDAGETRPELDGTGPYSRVVQYIVDDAARTVTQEWAYRTRVDGVTGPRGSVGDADRQINGNVLIVDGAIGGAPGDLASQIVEVTPDASTPGATPAFVLSVRGGAAWSVDRAERLKLSTPLS